MEIFMLGTREFKNGKYVASKERNLNNKQFLELE